MEARHATDCAAWADLLDPAAADDVAAAIDEIAAFEVLDASVLRLVALCDDPEATAADLVTVLERDPPFAANLLALANSAAYATPLRARTVRQAVMLVGRRHLRRLALATATVRFLDRAGGTGARHAELHAHALATAAIAVAAAGTARVAPDAVHLAALLHDLGRLVLPRAFGEAACDAIDAPTGSGRAAAERAAFGIDHAQAGALLCERWGLPVEVAGMVAWHHGGPDGATSPGPQAACVQVAELLASTVAAGAPDPLLLAAALAAGGIDRDDLDALAACALPPARRHPPEPGGEPPRAGDPTAQSSRPLSATTSSDSVR